MLYFAHCWAGYRTAFSRSPVRGPFWSLKARCRLESWLVCFFRGIFYPDYKQYDIRCGWRVVRMLFVFWIMIFCSIDFCGLYKYFLFGPPIEFFWKKIVEASCHLLSFFNLSLSPCMISQVSSASLGQWTFLLGAGQFFICGGYLFGAPISTQRQVVIILVSYILFIYCLFFVSITPTSIYSPPPLFYPPFPPPLLLLLLLPPPPPPPPPPPFHLRFPPRTAVLPPLLPSSLFPT